MHHQGSNVDRSKYLLGIFLCAFIWLWPYTHGPLPQIWPNLVAWACGFIFLVFIYRPGIVGNKIIVDGLFWASIVSAIIALAQYFDWEWVFEPLVATTVPGYAYANTRQTNHLATLMVVGVGISLWKISSEANRSGNLIFALILTAALAATASRGGAIQLLLALFICLFYLRGRANIPVVVVLLLVFYFVMSWGFPALYEIRFGEESPRNLFKRVAGEGGCSSRLYLWGNVVELIGMRPLAGWGWDGLKYAHYDNLFNAPRFCDLLSNAHNLMLQLAVSAGIPVAFAVGFIAVYFVIKQKPLSEKDGYAQISWMIFCVLGFHQMVEYPLWFGNFQMMAVMALLLLLSQKQQGAWIYQMHDLMRGVVRKLSISLIFLLVFAYYAISYVKTTQLFLPQDERLEFFQQNTREKVGMPWFFDDQILFAYVVTTDPSRANASDLLGASLAALRVSPEPRVIERVIVSAALLGDMKLAQYHELRYKMAWPEYYKKWVDSQSVTQ